MGKKTDVVNHIILARKDNKDTSAMVVHLDVTFGIQELLDPMAFGYLSSFLAELEAIVGSPDDIKITSIDIYKEIESPKLEENKPRVVKPDSDNGDNGKEEGCEILSRDEFPVGP
jgi:hypothetical protein